jgi:hypothetical protein
MAANAGTTGASPVIYTTLGAAGYDTVNLNNVGAGPTSANGAPPNESGDGPIAVNVNATEALIGVEPPVNTAVSLPASLEIVPVSGGPARGVALSGLFDVRSLAPDPVDPNIVFAMSSSGTIDRVDIGSSGPPATIVKGGWFPSAAQGAFANALRVTPDGAHLVGAWFNGGREWGVFETSSSGPSVQLSTFVTSGIQKLDLVIAPSGATAYVIANAPGNNVTALSAAVPITPLGKPLWTSNTGVVFTPSAVTISPDGNVLYVAGIGGANGAGTVQEMAAANGALRRSADIGMENFDGGAAVNGIADAPDGSTLVIVGRYNTADGLGYGAFPVRTATLTAAPSANLGSTGALGYTDSVAITPDQAPTANLAPAAGTAGVSLTLDASASNVRYGSIVRYFWLFGDGGSATTGGPTISHTYTAPGVYTATVTETDSAGGSIPPAPHVPGAVDGPGKTAYVNAGFQARTTALVAIGQPGRPPPTIPSVTTTTTTVKPTGTPVITVTPQVGHPGEVIWVTGHGFLPNHPVTVKWSIGSGSFIENADIHGNLPSHSILLPVPTLLGPRMAVATSPGSPVAQHKFLVVPSTAEPGSGSGSDTFMFRSEGP